MDTWDGMRPTSLLMAVALGAALVMSACIPYDLVASQLEINRSPAVEVIKADAVQAAMAAHLDRPTMPAGMQLVLPQDVSSRFAVSAKPS